MDSTLIQILLPLSDNEGGFFLKAEYARVREEVTARLGGLTGFTRGPAEGFWQEATGTSRDDVLVFEVMADSLDVGWWASYRRDLAARFRQDSLVMRAQPVQLL